jgi:uncharacterized tellurite resistance protein B-like protein
VIAGIRQFLSDLAGGRAPNRFSDDDYRLAAAALLYHATAVDGIVSEAERQKLRELLARRFALDASATDALVAAAKEAESEAVDLYGFTSVLKRQLDEADRNRIVEMMWELVFADGQLHEFEDNLIWRVAELLGVSSHTRLRLKQTARGSAAS